ncbi:50S ribosomal protein L30e [archaeon]|nr:50S ribosomal protein L30e [archaeon]
MDINRALRNVVSTGKVYMGFEQTKKYLEKGVVKMVIVSSNCPYTEHIKKHSVPVHKYSGSNMELGAACGKPFPISVISIVDSGESDILHISK